MKYKYHKGSEADFDGHENAVLAVKSATSGKIYWLSADYAGRDKDIEKAGDIVIAHREPMNITELDAWMQFTTTTESLITERGSRYGKFKDGAEIMRSLKRVMHDTEGWNNLTASQKEALDMIQHKIGRILNGDPTYDDSWKDIAGYATLIVNELNGEVK